MNTSGTGSPKGDDGLDEEVFWEDGQRYVRDRLGNVYIEEDSPEREVDEKTRKVLEERERNRIRRERREAKHRAPGYEPPEGSDVSTDSQLSEDEQERDKAIRKERKRQKIKAMKKRQIREERKSTAVIVSNIKHPRITDFDREFLVEWKRARLEYERQLDELAKHHGARALDRKMGYLQSCDPDLLRAMCECVWFEEVDEEGLKRKIDEILNTPTHSFGFTEADLDNYCKGLRMPAQGSVASRLGQFMKQVNDVIDKYALQEDLKVKGSLKMFFKAVVYRIDPPGLSNLVRFEIKKEPNDSMTAFAKLLKLHMERIEASDRLIQQQEQMEKKKRSPPMGWTNGDVKRRKNSPVKVHFEKPTMRGWGTERGFVGEGSERAKVKADDLFRFNQEQKQRAEEYRRVLENTQQNQAMSRGSSPAREMKQEKKSGAPGYDQQGQRVCFVCRQPGHKAADCKEASPNTQNRGFRKGKNAIKRFKKNKK
ncbi:hypothetical protein AC1031_008206 [Aphanomyces cochlioides]|nr:hypothetical protein AC1031_008206 [Aphanomyces cochlioides]